MKLYYVHVQFVPAIVHATLPCYCDTFGNETPCIFTERTMMPLWKRTGGDIARCIRHGNLICNETDADRTGLLEANNL